MTADGGGGNPQTMAAADDGSGGQRGEGFMRCKGEEDIWVSFPRIPMHEHTSSACYVYARRNSIPGE